MAHRKVHTRGKTTPHRALPGAALQRPWPQRHVDGGYRRPTWKRTVGRVVFPWDADYDADRQETNPAFQYYPWSSCTALAKPTCW